MQATHEGPSPNQGGGPFALSPEAPPAEPTRLAAGWQRSAGEGPSRAGTMPSSSPIARASHAPSPAERCKSRAEGGEGVAGGGRGVKAAPSSDLGPILGKSPSRQEP